jgi:hypothetical protein
VGGGLAGFRDLGAAHATVPSRGGDRLAAGSRACVVKASRQVGATVKLAPQSEASLHRQVTDYLSLCLGGSAWFTTFPAGGGGYMRGKILKSRGLKAGVPDVLIIDGGRSLWVELKTRHGRLSPDQKATHAVLHRAGAIVSVCRTLEEVNAALTSWGVPLKPHQLGSAA